MFLKLFSISTQIRTEIDEARHFLPRNFKPSHSYNTGSRNVRRIHDSRSHSVEQRFAIKHSHFSLKMSITVEVRTLGTRPQQHPRNHHTTRDTREIRQRPHIHRQSAYHNELPFIFFKHRMQLHNEHKWTTAETHDWIPKIRIRAMLVFAFSHAMWFLHHKQTHNNQQMMFVCVCVSHTQIECLCWIRFHVC